MGIVLMSKRELNRLDVLARRDGDRLTVLAAAGLMNVTPRQTYRLLSRYRKGAALAIANWRRGSLGLPCILPVEAAAHAGWPPCSTIRQGYKDLLSSEAALFMVARLSEDINAAASAGSRSRAPRHSRPGRTFGAACSPPRRCYDRSAE